MNGSVRTFPRENTTSDVVFVMSSCQRWIDDSRVFKQISARFERNWDNESREVPFVMLHMGDLHYRNIDENEVEKFEKGYKDVVSRKEQRMVFGRMPVVYVYDDHDYGSSNAGRESPSRSAALEAYRKVVPHWRLGSPDEGTPVYQALTIGRVRVVVTDLRSASVEGGNTTMGERQLRWFLDELREAGRYRVVVWVNTKPWIGKSDKGEDYWGGFAEERRTISNFIAENKIDNLVVASGDAHAVMADDGTNSDYSDRGGAGMPVFHAAPIANLGSAKGGPYSEGCRATVLARNYQYGALTIRDRPDNDGPCVKYEGFRSGRSSDSTILEFERCGRLGGVRGVEGGGQASRCSISLAPWWLWVVAVLIVLIFLFLIGFIITKCCLRKKRRMVVDDAGSHTD